jgi:hypothetical protein
MSEQKRFKAFRSELNESEYKEVLTGYPNRGIDTENGPVNFGPERMAQINAMLNAISRSTFQSPSEAFIRIKTRLNLLMLDFPWTPYLWQDGGTGPVTLTVTLFGRVDGIDGNTANVVMNGKANPTAGLQEFTLIANIEIAEDGLYRVTAKLQPQIAVMPEGVEHDGDSLDEMAQTAARFKEMGKNISAAERDFLGTVGTKSTKGTRKHLRKVYDKDAAEARSKKLYGKGGKVLKRKPDPSKGDVQEMAQTPARQRDMEHKIQRAEDKASRGYSAKMTKTGKAAERGRKQEAKADRASRSLIKRDTKEYDSPYLYGRGGKIVKRKGKPVKVKEEVVDEALIGGQKRLDMNKNKRLDAQDFKMLRSKKKPVEEALIGGQKKLDVNKNKRLDSQDFAMLRAKKKPMKEYTETMGGIPLTAPDPTAARADKSGKGKRFHKGAIKSVEEAVAKGKKGKKPSPHQGAANVIGKQKAIKSTLQKHDMRW